MSGRWNRQTRYSSAHAGAIGRLRRIGQVSCSWPQGVGVCGCSAVGSAAPCQGAGRGFDPRHPLQVREHPQWDADGVAVKSAPITRIGKQDLPPRILTAEQEHRPAALDQNSPALEVVVVVAQWQSGGRTPQVAGSIPAHIQCLSGETGIRAAFRVQCPKGHGGSNPSAGTTRHGSLTGGDSGKGGCDTPPPHLYGDVAHHARLPQGVPGQLGATAVRVRRQKGRRVLTFVPALRSADTVT